MEKSGKRRIGIILGSISVVMLVGSQYLNDILYLYAGGDRGFLATIIALTAALFLISLILGRTIVVNRYMVALLFIIIAAYVLTIYLLPGQSSLSSIDFFGMCILPIALGSLLTIDYKIVFHGCMLLLIIAIPVYGELFIKANIGRSYDAVSMSTSYDILPISIAGIIHMIYFGKNSKMFEKIMYLLSLFFTLSLIRMSYRGALLSIFISLYVAFFYRKKQTSFKKQVFLITTFLVLLLLILNASFVLTLISSILSLFDIRIAFIDKTIYLLQYDSLDHGRFQVYQSALNGFLSSPFWGNGMATFMYNTGYPFPHNFILEFLYDGGLLLFTPMLVIFGHALNKLVKSAWINDRYYFAFTMMIGSISLTRGMFSAESWRIVLLWLFLGLCLNKDYYIKQTAKPEPLGTAREHDISGNMNRYI